MLRPQGSKELDEVVSLYFKAGLRSFIVSSTPASRSPQYNASNRAQETEPLPTVEIPLETVFEGVAGVVTSLTSVVTRLFGANPPTQPNPTSTQPPVAQQDVASLIQFSPFDNRHTPPSVLDALNPGQRILENTNFSLDESGVGSKEEEIA